MFGVWLQSQCDHRYAPEKTESERSFPLSRCHAFNVDRLCADSSRSSRKVLVDFGTDGRWTFECVRAYDHRRLCDRRPGSRGPRPQGSMEGHIHPDRDDMDVMCDRSPMCDDRLRQSYELTKLNENYAGWWKGLDIVRCARATSDSAGHG